jgi:hypothetical protein
MWQPPSGRVVRGRGLRRGVDGPVPEFGLYLLGQASSIGELAVAVGTVAGLVVTH